ncbi:MAG: MATE family efflux transporter [Desulfomonilaceae bacterium]
MYIRGERYREVLKVASPLILSTASLTFTLFVDRMFLSWYSEASVAASVPGGITYFTICSVFIGTAQYVNSIVAQYHGAQNYRACAQAVWQGIFFGLLSAPLILACIPVGFLVFTWAGHDAAVQALEKKYFALLMVGGIVQPINAALASFFSGRGKTMVVMWGNIAGNIANACLAYILIFGKFGAPEMGIIGAGVATAVTGVIPTIFWAWLFLSRDEQPIYATRREIRLHRQIFWMLIRYGVPSGIQFFLDVASFTVFVLLIGRAGQIDLAASNIVLSIEMLAFLPMIGMSIATATLVGQYVGMKRQDIAEQSAYAAFKLAMCYMAAMALLFFLFPTTFLELFRTTRDAASHFDAVLARGTVFLRIVAVWTLFDTLFIIFSGALKGAGDTVFAMWAQVGLAWFFFVPPVYVITQLLGMGVLAAWCWGLLYVMLLGVVFWARFRQGKWRNISMIGSSASTAAIQ